MHGSINKSSIKLNMQRKFDMVICLRMGKTYMAKQAVTSKGISVPYTNLQLNPYPNIQLDLFYSDNLSFQCMTPIT